ncbi:MAG: protein translocase subunit SecF [Ignavibacteriales bacterium]|nr:protein translocase subunit SecF [Ignavibacteriales bacterium]
MRLFKKTNIDFLGKRKMWYVVSSIMVLIGMISVVFKGITYGIDFQGGTEIVLAFQQKIEISDIRTALTKVGLGNCEIKTYGADNYILINTPEQATGTGIADKIRSAIQTSFADKKFNVIKEDKVGPKVGKELRTDAMLAVFWSFIAILAYVAIRFKFAYGFGAVVALVHDVFTTLGFLSILNGLVPGLNLDISQEVIAAFLTLIGVSVNDTVIIFDRIRENEKIYRSMPLMDVMNKSLNDTLSRTIITSGTIFIVLIVLLIFGGEVNRGFAFTMAFGIVTGTYSSIYVASAFVLDYTRFRNRRKAAKTVTV